MLVIDSQAFSHLKASERAQEKDMLLRVHLPALRQLKISGYFKVGAGKLSIDRDSLSDAARLETLIIKHPGAVTLTPDSFTGLTALATLKLKSCGLARIPSAVAALAGSLTSLSLPLNDSLQLKHDDNIALLALPELQTLDLRKTGYTMYDTWSLRSMQRLVRLPDAFFDRHEHALDIRLIETFEEEDTESEGASDDEAGQGAGVEAGN